MMQAHLGFHGPRSRRARFPLALAALLSTGYLAFSGLTAQTADPLAANTHQTTAIQTPHELQSQQVTGFYFAHSGQVFAYGANRRLFTSADGGDSWQPVVPDKVPGRLDSVQADSGELLAVGDEGWGIISYDDGLTWLPLAVSGNSDNENHFAVHIPGMERLLPHGD